MAYEKLARLAPRLLGVTAAALNPALQAIERLLPISDRYRDVLLRFGGPIVFDNGAKFLSDVQSPLNDKDGYQSLEMLYGLGSDKNSVEQKAVQYTGELPNSFVPIGEASGGNLICVDSGGTVYLWDHESQRDEGAWRIASSIDEFLERLEPDDSDIGSIEGIIESRSFLDL